MRGKFLREVATLAGGTAFAQAINLVSLPILTRLYGPGDFGIFAVFTAAVAILGVFCTLKYENAIIAVESDQEAVACAALVFMSSIVSSTIILMVVVAGCLIVRPDVLGQYLFTVLAVYIMMIISSCTQCLYYLCNRFSKYREMSIGRLFSALFIAVFAIVWGWHYKSYHGLLIASIAGAAVNFLYLYKGEDELRSYSFIGNFSYIIRVAIKNIRYPQYLILSSFFDRFSAQLHIIAFARYFGAFATGSIGMHNRIVSLPISIVSTAVGDVFKRKASEELRDTGECRRLFVKTAVHLALIAVVPTILMIMYAPEIYVLALGAEWRQAGEFSRVLAIVFFLGFIVSPLSGLIYLENNQKMDLYLQVFLIALLIPGLGYAIYHGSALLAVIFYSIAYSIKYIVEFAICLYIANGRVSSLISWKK